MGFKQLIGDSSILICCLRNEIGYVSVYVDNLFLALNTMNTLNALN